MMNQGRGNVVYIALCCIAACSASFFSGCEDLLPVYVEPSNIFTSDLVSVDSTLVQYFESDEKDLTPEGPIISYNTYTPDLKFMFDVENIYEETLQSDAAIDGKLEVWNAAHPEEKATIAVSSSAINGGTVYNSSTNTITINPKEKIFFTVRWNYRFDSKKWLHQTVDIIGQQAITGTSYYVFLAPVELKSRFTISLFKKTKAITCEQSSTVHLRGLIRVMRP